MSDIKEVIAALKERAKNSPKYTYRDNSYGEGGYWPSQPFNDAPVWGDSIHPHNHYEHDEY